jgi:hypothetical protein
VTTDELQHVYKILWEDLPMCGCGNPETAVTLVHELLKLAPLYDHHDAVVSLLPSEGVYYLVLGALDEAGLLEHGSNISGSWLTDKGQWFLRALNTAGDSERLIASVDEVGFPHNGDSCTDRCWDRP